MPVTGPCDFRKASQLKLPLELFSGAEEQDARVDPVLAVGKYVVGVEHNPALADISDLEPFPQLADWCEALGVRELACPTLPGPVGRVAAFEAERPTRAQRRGERRQGPGQLLGAEVHDRVAGTDGQVGCPVSWEYRGVAVDPGHRLATGLSAGVVQHCATRVNPDHGPSRPGQRSSKQSGAAAQVDDRPRPDLLSQRTVIGVVLTRGVVDVVQLDKLRVTIWIGGHPRKLARYEAGLAPAASSRSNPNCQLGNLFGSGIPHGLTCGSGCPRVTVKHRSMPGLIAR